MMRPPWIPGPFQAWRLDLQEHESTWDTGVGAAKAGGRWNPLGYPVVYCSADPSTAILEVAVHKGFDVLDTTPHVMTSATILDTGGIHVVHRDDVPNPTWLRPALPSRGQQDFGRQLLEQHTFVLIPSAVSEESWNLIFNPNRAVGQYELHSQKRFALDTRLTPSLS
jgi:RES domain-containing protein